MCGIGNGNGNFASNVEGIQEVLLETLFFVGV
jgi:hypothetical protein